jgi:N-acetylglucosamine kinase-like BadF-type ATPase
MIKINKNEFFIGVDGGGTKTTAALADAECRIIKTFQSGPSSPRNSGIEKAAASVASAVGGVLEGREDIRIASTFIGLPAVTEEFSFQKRNITSSLKKKIPGIFKGKVKIGSDQEVAFRAGTDRKDGVVVIAGTGAVVRGWKDKRRARCSGWGWLDDEGSAFYVGHKTFRAALKDLDGRGPATKLTKAVLKEFAVKDETGLARFVYSRDPSEVIPSLSIVCDEVSKKRDGEARTILKEAASELAISINTVIKKLNLQRSRFPLVIVGGMFKSKILLSEVKRAVRKKAPRVEFVRVSGKPVIGAVRLASEL